ncbi:DOT1-domain-containing protein [Epithele typhae]|uniref:DOT1-domain-containing protein n=1 Tax=Epithele typhae TaxID=378194 RepID=UPI002008427F|nr:DOT1-domain-containing protein [Epithele typhae]KAH9913150.1 DOT1-domain-containing protein [Epithele typhae]
MTMGSSSTVLPATTDHSFFSKHLSSTSASHPIVATPQPPSAPPPPPTRAPSTPPTRDLDAFSKRKCSPKKRRVSPSPEPNPAPKATPAPPLRQRPRPRSNTSLAPSLPGPSRGSTPSTRATSVPPPPPPRECWTDEDGEPSEGFFSSEKAVVRLMKRRYMTYFINPNDPHDKSFEPHETNYPVATLEYPNKNACERYILLAPRDKDHYNPIMCLESSLYTMIQHYLTPEQAELLGSIPKEEIRGDDADDSDSDDEFSREPLCPLSDATPPPLSRPSTPGSIKSCSSGSSVHSTESSLSGASSLSSVCALSCYAKRDSPTDEPRTDHLRLLRRAIKERDGPLFLKVVDAINALLRLFKHPPAPVDPFDEPREPMHAVVRSWPHIPDGVVKRMVEEVYQRAVGPRIKELKRYEAFSSEVYGELMPPFVDDIVRATGLTANSLFLDLGSGVGNVALQASLATGCTSYGIEILPGPAGLASAQLAQYAHRCRMWGVRMGKVELEQGNMLQSPHVDALVKEADVVLVNNKVFDEPLNEALRQKFLDLKEGAIVVSLKCLMGSERNLDDIGEIFTVSVRRYHPGYVSWGGGGGEYFLQRMNREDYARRKTQFEKTRTRTSARARRWTGQDLY